MLRTSAPLIGALGAFEDMSILHTPNFIGAGLAITEFWHQSQTLRVAIYFQSPTSESGSDAATIKFTEVSEITLTGNFVPNFSSSEPATLIAYNLVPQGITTLQLETGTLLIVAQHIEIDGISIDDLVAYQINRNDLDKTIGELSKLQMKHLNRVNRLKGNDITCSFCGSSKTDDEALVRGGAAHICQSCARAAVELLANANEG